MVDFAEDLYPSLFSGNISIYTSLKYTIILGPREYPNFSQYQKIMDGMDHPRKETHQNGSVSDNNQ